MEMKAQCDAPYNALKRFTVLLDFLFKIALQKYNYINAPVSQQSPHSNSIGEYKSLIHKFHNHIDGIMKASV